MRRPEPVEGRRLGLSKGAVLSLSKGHREVARLCR
jgi:hypothetical protein